MSKLRGPGHHDKNEQKESRPEELDIEKLRSLAAEPEVVAIGECGLDYFRVTDQGSRVKQQEGFIKQIELAHELKKPLMIHCRSAFRDLLQILNSKSEILNDPPGAVHFFSGTEEEAKKLLDMGFAFTFGGVITFAREYDEVIKTLPLNAILSETDAPYVAPAPYRGKRNEPVYVVEVIQKLAEIRGVSVDDLARQIALNTENIFGVK